MHWRIITGDSVAGLGTIPDKSINTCVTSPPYWGLRQYLFDKAQVWADNLSDEQKAQVAQELARRGIFPRSANGSLCSGPTLEATKPDP